MPWSLDGETARCRALWVVGAADSYTKQPKYVVATIAEAVAAGAALQQCAGYLMLVGDHPVFQVGMEALTHTRIPGSKLVGFTLNSPLPGMSEAKGISRNLRGYAYVLPRESDPWSEHFYTVVKSGITTKLGHVTRGNFVTRWKTTVASPSISEQDWMSRYDLGRGLGPAEFWSWTNNAEYYNPTMAGQYQDLAGNLPIPGGLRPSIPVKHFFVDRGDGTATYVSQTIPVEFIVNAQQEFSKVFYRCRQGYRIDVNHLGIAGAHRVTMCWEREEEFPVDAVDWVTVGWSTQCNIGLFTAPMFDEAYFYRPGVDGDLVKLTRFTEFQNTLYKFTVAGHTLVGGPPAEQKETGTTWKANELTGLVLHDSGAEFGDGSGLAIGVLGCVRAAGDDAANALEADVSLTRDQTLPDPPTPGIDSPALQSMGMNSLALSGRKLGKIIWQFWVITDDFSRVKDKIDSVVAAGGMRQSPLPQDYPWDSELVIP